jgi:two-component system sensor histidine kinase AgrC
MQITIVDIFFIIIDLFVFTACAVFMVRLLPRKTDSPLWLRISAWSIFAILSIVLPNLGRNDILTIIVLILYYLAVGWFLYHKSKMGLLYQLVYMMSMYATQVMAIFLVVRLKCSFALEDKLQLYLLVMFKSLFLMMIMTLLKKILKKRYVADQQNLKIRGMVLVPVISMVLIFLYLIGGDVFFARYGYEWLILYCVLLLVINAYCLYFWYDVAANQRLKHRLELMRQQNECIHQYYEDLEKNYCQSRKIIHDIRNHINALEQSQKLEQTQKYFEDVHLMLNALGLRFYTDNRMLNIVLNDKLKSLEAEQVECSVGGIDLHFLSDIDITTIFSNLLDNAIEACEKKQEFWIKIKGDQIHDFLVIKLQNSYSGKYEQGSSLKQGHEGLGLENVRKTLEKYHGELKIESRENIFSATLVFPGQ